MDIAQLMIEGLFAVVLAGFGFFMRSISDDMKELTKAINDLRDKLLEDYVNKEEWQRMRDRMHELSNQVAGLMVNSERRKTTR